jgi:Na+/H+ antiporter NhaA
MKNFSIVVVRNKETQRGWRLAVAATFAVALGLVAVVGLPVPFKLLSR